MSRGQCLISLFWLSALGLLAPAPHAASTPSVGPSIAEDLRWLASSPSVATTDWTSIMRRRQGDPLFVQQALVFWPAMILKANTSSALQFPEFLKAVDLVFIAAPEELGVGEVSLRVQGDAGRIAGTAKFATAGFATSAVLQPVNSATSASFSYPVDVRESFSIEIRFVSGERISLQGTIPPLQGRGADPGSPIAGARCGGVHYRKAKATHDLETVVLAPGGLRPIWSSSQSTGSVPTEVARGNQIVKQCAESFRSGRFGVVLIRPELTERVGR